MNDDDDDEKTTAQIMQTQEATDTKTRIKRPTRQINFQANQARNKQQSSSTHSQVTNITARQTTEL